MERLSRNEMIQQLRDRMLYIPNIETLSLEQLEDIYRGFIVPLPRREQRERQQRVASAASSLPMEMELLRKRIQVVSVAEKRGMSDANTIDRKRSKMDLL